MRRSGAARTRTWDLRFWRPALPPTELLPLDAESYRRARGRSVRDLAVGRLDEFVGPKY
jgi:hypothetical protein